MPTGCVFFAGLLALGFSGAESQLDPNEVLLEKTGGAATVVTLRPKVKGGLLTVSCDGQVFDGKKALVSDDSSHSEVEWDGCEFSGGSCVSDSKASHVSKEPYCILGGTCVPHSPEEASPAGPLRKIVVLTQPPWGVYYHFFIDALSRFMWVKEQLPKVPKDPRAFFHTGMVSPAAQEWARLIGIETSTKESRLLDGWWTAKVVLFPPSNGCANKKRGAEPFAVAAMQRVVALSMKAQFVAAPTSAGSSPKVAVLVRRDPRVKRYQDARVVLNHEAVRDAISSALPGWSIEEFADYPSVPDVKTTCSLFHRASMILGPHGAGLSNLICARKGTPVIEFQQPPHSWDFELLSVKLELPYFAVSTDMEHYGPGSVDVEKLRRAVLEATRPANASKTLLDTTCAATSNPSLPVLNKKSILAETTGSGAQVKVWRAGAAGPLMVTCKGQVLNNTSPLVGSHSSSQWNGCDFNGGTCKWQSGISHVSQSKYCLLGDPVPCVEHGPGPEEPAGPLETIVVLTQPQWGAYYHFLIDALSRVFWLHAQHPAVLVDPKAFFHLGMVNEVGQAWARLAGIQTTSDGANRLLDGYWTARTVYFPPGNECANKVRGAEPFVISRMRTAVVSAAWAPSGPSLPPMGAAPKQALLVRRDPRVPRYKEARVILNHDSVVSKLEELLPGWEVVVFSDYPQPPDPVTTCQMFSRADMILGPHGAGLSNLICARKGTPVVEFQQWPHSWDFELLSLKLGLPYRGISTKMEHYGPGRVDLNRLQTAVLCSLKQVAGLAQGQDFLGAQTLSFAAPPAVPPQKQPEGQSSSGVSTGEPPPQHGNPPAHTTETAQGGSPEVAPATSSPPEQAAAAPAVHAAGQGEDCVGSAGLELTAGSLVSAEVGLASGLWLLTPSPSAFVAGFAVAFGLCLFHSCCRGAAPDAQLAAAAAAGKSRAAVLGAGDAAETALVPRVVRSRVESADWQEEGSEDEERTGLLRV